MKEGLCLSAAAAIALLLPGCLGGPNVEEVFVPPCRAGAPPIFYQMFEVGFGFDAKRSAVRTADKAAGLGWWNVTIQTAMEPNTEEFVRGYVVMADCPEAKP